ncbi:MAG TPA: sugar phosphate isomerase/epimerase family protein [Chitinophagaceae bacterium]|nr:sugar phosphate isomerase/epimerase family protein [Chitinophagaceae bacterium]
MALHVKLGVSTWLWTSPFKTDEAAALFFKIKKFGYEVVEIAVEDPTLIDTREIKNQLKANGLSAVICGAFGPTRDLTSEDESLRKTGLSYIEDCLEIAGELGSDLFAGPMYSAVGKARLVSSEQKKIEWERAVQGIRTTAGLARKHGLKLALEPLNRFESDLINTVEDLLSLIRDINEAAVGIGLDMFHMNIEEPDPEQAIIDAGDKLLHMQVSENFRGTPGTGSAPWEAYYAGLSEIGYKGIVSIESFAPANKELAAAVCIWKNLAADQDSFARDGNRFLKHWLKGV